MNIQRAAMTDVKILSAFSDATPGRRQPARQSAPALGDAGLRQLVLEHYDREQVPLRRYLVFLGVRDATAQEIVQESFLRLFRHLGANGDRANLRAWIYRVAHNLARNEQSAVRERRCDSLNTGLAEAVSATSGDSPEASVLHREKFDRLATAIQALSEPQRECLILRAQGLKYREIADVAGLSISSVAENVQRGLGKLRELL
jgi:RNA polymerase sigma-70 factor, ECF subfamily